MATSSPAIGKAHRPEDTKNLIVAAAADLVLETGPAKLTHRNVAARAGVSVGSTTKYFSSIEDLRAQAVVAAAQLIRADAEAAGRAVAEASDPIGAGIEIVEQFLISSIKTAPAELALLAEAARALDGPTRELAASWTHWLANTLAPRFGQAPALAIAVFLDGAWVYTALHHQPPPREVIETFFSSLTSREGEQQ